MTNKFPELFEYSFHYNQEIIKTIALDLNRFPEKVLQLTNHILSSHQVWNSRILGQPSIHPWQIHPFEELLEINESNYLKTKQILENFDLTQIISYKTSKGDLFKSKIEDILFHVINHCTYHRGQIALLFRESGIEPLVTDYIFYKR